MFPCQAPRGAPTPLVTWFRGGKLVVEGPGRKIQVVVMVMVMVMVIVMVMVMVMTAMEKIIHANKVLSLLLLLFCNLRLFSNYHLSAAFSFINYLLPAAFIIYPY